MSSWPKVSKREVRIRVLYTDFSQKKKKTKVRNAKKKNTKKKEYKSEEAKSPNEGTIV